MKISVFVLVIVMAMVVSSPLFTEDEYKISGRVIRNNTGVSEVSLSFSSEGRRGVEVITDKEGRFSVYLPKGKYSLLNDYTFENDNYLIAIGPNGYNLPYRFEVSEKNIVNLNVRLYTQMEIVEANRAVFEQKIDHPTITTRWGEIPIYSMKECKKFAEGELVNDKERRIIDSDLFQEAVLGSPVVFYDLHGNPSYYQFPEIVRNIGVSYVGVFAIGKKPRRGNLRVQIADTDEELREVITKKTQDRVTSDIFIPDVIKRTAEILKCDIGDIEIVRLLCIKSSGYEPFYAMVKVKTTGEIYVLHLHYCSISKLERWDVFYQKYFNKCEVIDAYNYVWDCKSEMGIPLMNN